VLESRLLLSAGAAPLAPAHVVIVMEEDRFANAIGDTADMPYVNQLAANSLVFSDLQGLNTVNQEGEMNYLGLFSGSTQGVTDDGIDYSFSGPNLAEQFNSAPGLSYAGYSEGLPDNGWEVDVWPGTQYGYTIPDLYTRAYNPTAMFTDLGPAGTESSAVNQTFSQFQALATAPGTYANLPTVSLVVPDQLDNTHGSLDTTPMDIDPAYYNTFRQWSDSWLQENIDPYVQWAKTHDSLLIVMGDEGDRAHNFANGTQAIITGDPKLFVPGTDTTPVNAYDVLRTIEDMYGQTPLGNSATVSDLDTNAGGQLAAPDTAPPDTIPPTTPGTPTLTSATSTTATIAWAASTDNVGVRGYNIYRNGTLAGTVNGSTTSFTDTGLTVDTRYSYTVVAFDAAQNNSPASAALSVTTPDTTPPTTPGTPTLKSATSTTATIAWAASTDNVAVTGYNIYRNAKLAGTVNGSTTSFTDTGLTVNTTYSYTVVAFDAAKNDSPASAALSVITPDTTPPATPGTPTLSSVTSTTAKIAWAASTDNVGVTGYDIYRNAKLAGTVNGTTTSFTDAGLTASTKYSYTVVAFDAAQNKSAASGALSVTTAAASAGPTVPGTPTLTSDTETTATIAWGPSTDSAGITAYKIYRNGTLAGSVSGTTTTFTDTGLKAYTTYSYTVIAVDANQKQSAASAALVIKTPDTTPPTVPAGLALVSKTSTTVTIKWTASTDNVLVAGYDIYRNGVDVGWVGQGITTFTDSNLAPSTTYKYQVAAWDETYDFSALSSGLSVTTAAAAAAPTVAGPSLGGGTGLTATYYKSKNLTSPVKTRVDPTINFSWGKTAPVAGTAAEQFSVEWVGQVQARSTETYTFYTTTTGGVRVWVDGKLLINNWTAHTSTTDKGTIALVAGQKYDVKVEYFDSGNAAACVLDWSTPTIAKSVIPASALFEQA